jgi:tetratricopeptide (TPR) repeat protein
MNRLPEARTQIDQAVALVRRLYGENHPRMALPLSDLGRIETAAGNFSAAANAHRRAMAISLRAFGPAHASTLSHRNNLATALMAAGNLDLAIVEYKQLLAVMEGDLPRGEVAQNLAVALVQQGDFRGAEQNLHIAQSAFAKHLPANHPRQAFPSLTRSEMRIEQRRWAEAESEARIALAGLSKSLPAGHFATETARCRVGIALLGQGKSKAAGAFVKPALAALEAAGKDVPARFVTPCREAANQLKGVI